MINKVMTKAISIDCLLQCIEQGKFVDAEHIACALIIDVPDNMLGWKALGVVYHLIGNIQSAILSLDKAVLLSPFDSESYINLGYALQSVGRHKEAVHELRNAVRLQPDSAQARSNLALSLLECGQGDEAIRNIESSIMLQPGYADAFNNFGFMLQRKGCYSTASWGFRHASFIMPQSAKLLSNLAICLHALRNLNEAEQICRSALTLSPFLFEAHNNLGVVLKDRGDINGAGYHTRIAITLDPSYPDALNNISVLYYAEGKHHLSEINCRRALVIRPIYYEAWNNLGNALCKMGDAVGGISAYNSAIRYNSTYAEAYNNLSVLLYKESSVTNAVVNVRKALICEPGYASAWCNMGALLKDYQDKKSDESYFMRAIQINPGYSDAYNNLGITLHNKKRFEEAGVAYKKAIDLDCSNYLAKTNNALLLLLLGFYDAGFSAYENRFLCEKKKVRNSYSDSRLWSGMTKLVGETILLYSEQGLGDTIQFSRYARYLASKGANVVFEVQKPLEMLFIDKWEGVDVVSQDGAIPRYDWCCPVMSVPNAIGFDSLNIPYKSGYLTPDSTRLLHWKSFLGKKTKKRIGVCFSGQSSHDNDSNRSMPWSTFREITKVDAEYYILQTEIRGRDVPYLDGSYGVTIPPIDDFCDTACLVTLMDLVITVDTCLAHLSGALGQRTWVLLPWVPDWRWQLDLADTQWYESIKLFRQIKPGSWSEVLSYVEYCLLQEVNSIN